MEPVPTQTAYADSDRIPRNVIPLIIKSAIGVVLLAVIFGLVAYYVWPLPQTKTTEQLQTIEDHFNKNDLDGALAAVEDVLAEDPDNVQLLIAKSLTLAQKGSIGFKEEEYGTEAVAVAEQAVAAGPNTSEAYRALAYAYEIQEKYDLAHQNYEKAIELNPNNAYAVFGNAHSYDLQGDMAKAEEGYRLALSLDPNFDKAHVGLARALAYRGDEAGALSELKQAFELSHNVHDKAESAYSIARIALLQKDVPTALHYAQQSVRIAPEYALGWYIQGTVMFVDALNEEKYPNASDRGALMMKSLGALQHAVTLNPNQTLAHLQLGTELSAIGNREQGELAFAKALEVVDKDITLNAIDKESVRTQIIKAQELAAKVALTQATANTSKN